MDPITIIGGGIAGLALAAGLDPQRFDVTLHEQRPGVPPVETSLAMWPEAQAALALLGILPDVRAASTGFGGMALRDSAGNAWGSPEVRGVLGVSRADLLMILDAAVPHAVQRVAGRVDDVPASGPLAAGLLVGADGVHSVVRRTFWGKRAAAKLTPYLALRGVLAEPIAPDAGGEYWGRGQLFGITPASGGRTYWYASFRSDLGPAGIDAAEALQRTRERFAGSAPAIGRVLAKAAPESTLAQRIWTVPTLGSFVRPGAVLIGDAAHGMTPNLGRGACEAIVDAANLAELLNAQPMGEALRAYNRQRVVRTQLLRVASSAMTGLALTEHAQPLRDRLLGLAAR
ncbi:FAD-dependent monooxygenase [Arthrobacter sp. ZGTC131]|uniref:FAD-dependent monooxygenase n=1 Tax=Arthrobacter sp. ZGTC131 TaxID=2058898 RepID=UPI000CE4FF00|nr:FAD-dependent monooxygenase [Arthrobacter sp. ZGTC131]